MSAPQLATARSSGPLVPLLLAVLALVAVAGAVFYFNPHKVSELHVSGVETFAPHTTFGELGGTTGKGMHVLGGPTSSSEDDLYIIASVQMADKLRLPLFITGATAHVTLEDGSVAESTLLSAADLKRLEVIFPEIAQKAVAPIGDGDEIDPGQTRVGTLVFPFPGRSAAAWRSKKGAILTIDLRNQDAQKAMLP